MLTQEAYDIKYQVIFVESKLMWKLEVELHFPECLSFVTAQYKAENIYFYV